MDKPQPDPSIGPIVPEDVVSITVDFSGECTGQRCLWCRTAPPGRRTNDSVLAFQNEAALNYARWEKILRQRKFSQKDLNLMARVLREIQATADICLARLNEPKKRPSRPEKHEGCLEGGVCEPGNGVGGPETHVEFGDSDGSPGPTPPLKQLVLLPKKEE
ncbi:hypothetical protein NUW58_g3513 [Xylaria curta]|uniref:Uncharacterized protein n=1 Tax=Xylaria curta TaxID=42375 RepID=A0ACC1PD99_9PEZI|nr:hypothetical protein NUW58_g3513 [Xylaria curta]